MKGPVPDFRPGRRANAGHPVEHSSAILRGVRRKGGSHCLGHDVASVRTDRLASGDRQLDSQKGNHEAIDRYVKAKAEVLTDEGGKATCR